MCHSWCSVLFFRPLHIAARNGLKVVVEELLAKGACVLAVDENGKWNKLAIARGTMCLLQPEEMRKIGAG